MPLLVEPAEAAALLALARERARGERVIAAPDAVALAERCGLIPDPWQADVLRSTARRLILNVTRQGGKSTITSILALHTALYQAPALVLLLSPSLRQSQELFRKVLDAYRAIEGSEPSEAESALRLELANGSRIIALPGKEGTIRGYSGVTLLVLDEASRIADGLYYSTRPMLAVSGGRLVMLSTPFGKRGVFHQEWTAGEDWHRVEITGEQCPRIAPSFLAEEKATLPHWVYEQEYLCQFMDTEDSVFAFEDIQAALSADVVPLFGDGAL